MKKIAILGLHLSYGGVERAIANQANALVDDFKVELAISYNKAPAFDIAKSVEIKYLTNYWPNRQEFMQALKHLKLIQAFKEGLKSIKILKAKKNTMIAYIKNTDADIIISTRLEITKLLNKYALKNTITIHEEHTKPPKEQKYLKKLKKASSNISYLITVSKELKEIFTQALPHKKIIYLPNTLSYWPTKTSNLNSKELIAVGRLSKEKGFLTLIDTFKIINELDPTYHLNIIGDGKEYSKIIKRINKYNLSSKVTMHGFQNKDYINKCLANSSLYLMTSYEESFGIVLIEAASFGIPLLAFTSATGAKEIIKDNINGYLIENRNKEEYANKALDLLHNPDKLQEFGQNARSMAEEYSFSNVKLKYLDFFKNL